MGSTLTSLGRWAVPGPLIAALVVLALVATRRPELGDLLGSIGMVVGMTTAGILILTRSAGLATRERSAWRFFAIGTFLASLGVLVTAGLVLIGVELPAFGLVDGFFLGAYVTIVIALSMLARADSGGRDWALTLFDALIGAVALATLIWSYFHDQVLTALSRAEWWEWIVALVYPVVDVMAVIALGILMMRRSHFHWDPRLLFVAVTLLLQAAADLLYLGSGLGNSFVDADPQYALFLLASASAVAAGASVDRTPRLREFPERNMPFLALVWPYLLVAALLVTHVVRYHAIADPRDDVFILDALLVIGLIALVRQLVVIHRHRTRVELQRSELVASVSHELRTPLTAIVGYLSILEESGEDFHGEARRQMLSDATSQARHMARLVTDLVLLARGIDHHVQLEVAETRLRQLIAAAVRSLGREGSRVEVDLPSDVVVRVDGDRLRQATTNLLTNAVRYGGDRVVVTAAVRNRSDLVLEVHDNGGGVPTRFENTVWERFERGAHRLNASTPGMGIGLAIVRAVADAHGGLATYRRSELMDGACFSMSIPGCVLSAVPVDA